MSEAVAKPSLGPVLAAAVVKAAKSGSAGFIAGTIQVIAFMWLRTVMNYQYKYGGGFGTVLGKLWGEGGLARLYRGLFPWAIFQAPLSRFGDVAANEMILSVMGTLFPSVSVGFTTWLGSMGGALWRVFITPVDTCKTTLQTDGQKGWTLLQEKMKKGGIAVLWAGWEANYVANVIGNYPWFVTMNLLQGNIAIPQGNVAKLVRSAFIGAVASSVSDVISNCIRVIKTKKQTTSDATMGYVGATKQVLSESGIYGLFFRGLETRLLTNVLQGAFFTVLWKAIQDAMKG